MATGLHRDIIKFDERAKRTQYIKRTFSQYFGKSVLDVGCDRAVLKGMLDAGCDYTGIDIGGTPDIQVNLEQIDRLPFDDGAFDCIICSDVLEHLDNLHHVFLELLRVSRGRVIIGWPNNWVVARRPIERGRGSFAHYGLPVDKPDDRHKWFFSYTQAREFVHAHASRDGLDVLEERICEKPRNKLVFALRHMRYPKADLYYNRYSHTYWSVLGMK